MPPVHDRQQQIQCYQRRDCGNFQQHESALHVAASARAETVDARQCQQRRGCDGTFVPSYACERAKVRGENHRDCGHAASLRDQKQSPSIHERDRRMIRVAQVDVLTAGRARQTRREFSPDEGAAHREQATEYPDAQNQKRRVHSVRDLGRIGKNSRAHDAAHHDHRRVKQPKLTARFVQCCHSERSRIL